MPTCEHPKWMLAESSHEFASLDIDGNRMIDASDLAAFYSGGTPVSQTDFNGDGVTDAFDEIILLDRLGTPYTAPVCSVN